MEKVTKKIENNGNTYEFTFINEFSSNRNGFYHSSTLFTSYCSSYVSKAKMHYINRTWESYSYQTSMKSTVYTYMDKQEEKYKKEFLQSNNYKRMTKERKKEFEKILDEKEKMQVLRKLLREL